MGQAAETRALYKKPRPKECLEKGGALRKMVILWSTDFEKVNGDIRVENIQVSGE